MGQRADRGPSGDGRTKVPTRRLPPSLDEVRIRVQSQTHAHGAAVASNGSSATPARRQGTTASLAPRRSGHRVEVGERVAEFLAVFGLHDVDKFQPRHFIEAIDHLGKDTPIQDTVRHHIDGNADLGRQMQARWHDLRQRQQSSHTRDESLLILLQERPVALARYLLTGR
jgi:hypothetical protein